MEKKIFVVQSTTYYSGEFDIMIRDCKKSMKVEQPKEAEGAICWLFTTFTVLLTPQPPLHFFFFFFFLMFQRLSS